MQNRVLGEAHPDTLKSRNNLALVYQNQGRYDDAERLYLETLEIKERVLGKDHPHTANTMGNLALMYVNRNRYEEAEPLYLEALGIQRHALGEAHPATLLMMMNVAELYARQGEFGKALPLQEQALAAARRVWADGGWFTGAFLGDYGVTLLGLERFEDAEAALLEAHEILATTRGPEFERTINAAESLVELYDAWGKPEKAAEWRAKLPTEQEAVASDQPADNQ